MCSLADGGDLIRTCVLEAGLAAVVITVSAVRRWHRRTGQPTTARNGEPAGLA